MSDDANKLIRRVAKGGILVTGLLVWPVVVGILPVMWRTDQLSNPVQVSALTAAALQLQSGQLIQLPGVTELAHESEVLTKAVEPGAEIQSDGEVWGLLRVRQAWCFGFGPSS